MREYIDRALKYIGSKQMDAYEIYVLGKGHFLADCRDGRVESLDSSSETALAVRVIKDSRQGFSYTTSLADIPLCIDCAEDGVKCTEPDEEGGFAMVKGLPVLGWQYKDEKLGKVSVSRKTQLALDAEASALKFDPRVARVRKSIYEELHVTTYLVNSNGVDCEFGKTLAGCEVMTVAEDKSGSQSGWDSAFAHTFDGLDAIAAARKSAERAVFLLGAEKIPTMKSPVLLDPHVGAQLLEVFCRGFYGDNIYKKKSALAGKLGEKAYASALTIIDDGILSGGFSSAPFDDEGEPRKKVPLVEGGVIKNYLTDICWGRRLGLPSSGSSTRHSPKELPAVGISNAYIEASGRHQSELMKDMWKGFYVTDIAGAHTINPISGDFSVGAAGAWVENGVLKHPVSGVMLSGNLHDLFRNISAVADDLTFIANVGSPTILVRELQISGSG